MENDDYITQHDPNDALCNCPDCRAEEERADKFAERFFWFGVSFWLFMQLAPALLFIIAAIGAAISINT